MGLVRVICNQDGTVKIETEGFQGTSCQAASAPFERLFGPATSDEPTAEMWEINHQQNAENTTRL